MNWKNLDFFKDTGKYQKIIQFLKTEMGQGKIILPPGKNIFNAFKLTPFKQVKVLILGQDPYPTPGHANGLAFSVQPDVKPLPRSLQNIFKELVNDIGCEYPASGDLSPWAKQGVLLLNTSLTVEANKPNSHRNLGWGILIREVISKICEEKEGVVFIFWGKNSQFFNNFVNEKHHVIMSAHPSPLSAERGFFGSKPFTRTNELLEESIDWSLTNENVNDSLDDLGGFSHRT